MNKGANKQLTHEAESAELETHIIKASSRAQEDNINNAGTKGQIISSRHTELHRIDSRHLAAHGLHHKRSHGIAHIAIAPLGQARAFANGTQGRQADPWTTCNLQSGLACKGYIERRNAHGSQRQGRRSLGLPRPG